MNRFGFGLRTTIVVNISLVMLITMLLIGFVVITMARKTLYDNKRKTAEALALSIQTRILPSLSGAPGPNKTLKTLLEEYTSLHSLESIVVVDSSGTVLAAFNKHTNNAGTHKTFFRKALKTGEVLTKILSVNGNKYLSVVAPIKGEKAVWGAVSMQIPLAGVEASIVQFQQAVMLFAISTALVFIVAGTLLLSRYLVKPLEKLIKATEDISGGYVPKHLESGSSNEIGTLSLSLARMSDKLREDKDKINAYITSLEESNRKLKLAQDEVIRSEKLASVGRLAAGVAHEIGNPIGIILGYVEILRQQIIDTPDNAESLDRLEKEVMRIDTIIRELLSFSRPGKIRFQHIQPNAVIKEATSIISHQKGFRDITLELSLDESLPTITADERLLQQVLVNLFLNAMDAMPDGGKLSVSSEYRNLRNYGPLDYSLPRDGITILVKDSGSGIKENEINKIFDPFFTTKSPGKGTGLGLAVSHRIIESLGGRITVESIPGKCTVFSIILPATQEKQKTA